MTDKLSIEYCIFSLIIIIFSLVACGKRDDSNKLYTSKAVEVTITAYDPASDSYINNINIWNDYNTRNRVVAKAVHRDKVKMLKRVGDGVLIETAGGKQGWVSYFFIKEIVLKEGIPVWDKKLNNFKNQVPDPSKL